MRPQCYCRRRKELETVGGTGGDGSCMAWGWKQDVHRCGEDLLGWDWRSH